MDFVYPFEKKKFYEKWAKIAEKVCVLFLLKVESIGELSHSECKILSIAPKNVQNPWAFQCFSLTGCSMTLGYTRMFVVRSVRCRMSKHWGEEFRIGIVWTKLHKMENVLIQHS